MALLSPLLEKLVLSGEAKFKTSVVGQSGHAVLSSTRDKLIIIVEFDYQNFIDALDPEDTDQLLQRSVHQLQFRSKKSANHFIIREPMHFIGGGGGGQVSSSGTYQKETFLIHDSNVEISIVAMPTTIGAVNTTGVSNADLGSQAPPLGYGSGAGGVLSTTNYEDGAGEFEYLPQTRGFGVFAAASPFPVSQLLLPVTSVTALLPTNNGLALGMRTFPIVNVSYIEINRELADKVFSSS